MRRTPLVAGWRCPSLDFSDPDGLCHSMRGAGVFYNTYRVRYAHGRITFDLAVENTRTLFEAAKRAGVGRIVHLSVTNPSSESELPYFRGKAQVEDMLVGLEIPRWISRSAWPHLIWSTENSVGSRYLRATQSASIMEVPSDRF